MGLYDAFITDFSWAFFKGRGYPGMYYKAGKANFTETFPHYAPELLSSRVDKLVDIYSLGSVLQRMSTKSTVLAKLLGPLAARCKNTKSFLRPSIKIIVNDLTKMLKQI